MKLTIQPNVNKLWIEELAVTAPDGAITAIGTNGREIADIRWDGDLGTIRYASNALGMYDVEFFRDPTILQSFLAVFRDALLNAFDGEQTRLEQKKTALGGG